MRSQSARTIELIQFTVEVQGVHKTTVNQDFRTILVISRRKRTSNIVWTGKTKAKTITLFAMFLGISVR